MQPGGAYDTPTMPTITWPVDHSVFQRNTTSTGGNATITFSGQVINRNNVTYRIEKLNQYGLYITDYQTNTSLPYGALNQVGTSASGYYYFTRSIPTGWYRFTILDGNGQIRQIKFGVGEVFIIAGQSNAQGAGDINYISSSSSYDCVVSSDGLKLLNEVVGNVGGAQFSNSYYPYLTVPIMHPLNKDNANIAPCGERPWFYQELGNLIAVNKEPGTIIPVAFFNTALSGSSIDNWYKSMNRTRQMFSNNYTNPLTIGSIEFQNNPWVSYPNYDNRFPYILLKNTLSFWGNVFGVRTILWHQGEAETHSLEANIAGYNIYDYRNKLNAIIADTRQLLPNLPWSICKVSLIREQNIDNKTRTEVINEQQAVFNANSLISWASQYSDSYTYPNYRSDGTHFNQLGLTSIANEIYSNMTSIISKSPVAPAVLPRLSLVKAGSGNGENASVNSSLFSYYQWLPNIFYESMGQTYSDAGNFKFADFGIAGYTKDALGRVFIITPNVAIFGISGARISNDDSLRIININSNAYPNPLIQNKLLTISFDLEQPSPVTLTLFDDQGNILHQVNEATIESGNHKYSFSFEKLYDKSFKFIYYVIKTNSNEEVKRILLAQ
jgi:hypothetical protein